MAPSKTAIPEVPAIRVRECNAAPVHPNGKHILYWMIASRRLAFNFALDRALEYCRELRKPLFIFEPLRCDYPWASERLHRFVIDGMAYNASVCAQRGVLYCPYVEPLHGAGRGLLEALAVVACVVITDDFPSFFLPRMIEVAAKKLSVRLEAVDSNGLLPMRAANSVFTTAYSFRRFLQKTLPPHLADFPAADALSRVEIPKAPPVSKSILSRWPAASGGLLRGNADCLAALPIDHGVGPAAIRGGCIPARRQLADFLKTKLPRYAAEHSDPEAEASSGLSPYLHFGHISAHEVFAKLARAENWHSGKLALRATGSREGWWNISQNAEAFLDELITWRELGFNFCAHRDDYDQFDSLPDWARKTLREHARDEREFVYSLEQFESAKTHDPLWNAAQNQLLTEGRIHNYLRMLWGKKILEWSSSPKRALEVLIHLNNKYALDGRDPNSYSGIFWCLGRYDRPWGPERPIFGLVRYMSSQNTARKFSLRNYLKKYARGPKLP